MYSEELENLISVIKTKSTKFYLKLKTIEYNSLVLSVEYKLQEGVWDTLFNLNSRNKDKVMTNQIIKFAETLKEYEFIKDAFIIPDYGQETLSKI